MREYFVKSKWKLIKLAVLLSVFLLVVGYINGKSVYEAKMKQLEAAKQQMADKKGL